MLLHSQKCPADKCGHLGPCYDIIAYSSTLLVQGRFRCRPCSWGFERWKDFWAAWQMVEEIIGDRLVDLIEIEMARESLRQAIQRHGTELQDELLALADFLEDI